MKQTLALIGFLLLTASTLSIAQSPVPEPDTLYRVKQTDPPATSSQPAQNNYRSDENRITSQELPRALKITLSSSQEYAGWERADIYFDKKRGIYSVDISQANTIKSYRFSKDGKPIEDE